MISRCLYTGIGAGIQINNSIRDKDGTFRFLDSTSVSTTNGTTPSPMIGISPNPELLIRTSGETRLSDFLTWQTIHSQLTWIKPLWPEFSFWHLGKIILDYQKNVEAIKKQREWYEQQQQVLQYHTDLYYICMQMCKEQEISSITSSDQSYTSSTSHNNTTPTSTYNTDPSNNSPSHIAEQIEHILHQSIQHHQPCNDDNKPAVPSIHSKHTDPLQLPIFAHLDRTQILSRYDTYICERQQRIITFLQHVTTPSIM